MQRALHNTLRTENGRENWNNKLISRLFKIITALVFFFAKRCERKSMRQWKQRKNGPISGPMPNLSHHLGQTSGWDHRHPLKRSLPGKRTSSCATHHGASFACPCGSGSPTQQVGDTPCLSPSQIAEELCRFGGETTSDFSCNHDNPRPPTSACESVNDDFQPPVVENTSNTQV